MTAIRVTPAIPSAALSVPLISPPVVAHAIADRLGLSEKTVRNHVSNVLLKLQVPDRTAAALKAREAGLGG